MSDREPAIKAIVALVFFPIWALLHVVFLALGAVCYPIYRVLQRLDHSE